MDNSRAAQLLINKGADTNKAVTRNGFSVLDGALLLAFLDAMKEEIIKKYLAPEEKRYYAYFRTFIQYWKQIPKALRAKALPNEIIDIIFEAGSFHDEFINIIRQFGMSQLRAQEISSLFFSRINQPDAVWDAFMCDKSTQESSLASTRFSMH